MENYGFITLQRKILDWEWYKDSNTKLVFIHLLLKANWKDAKWRGIDVKRGQVVTSIRHLSDELNITERSIRTSLERLAKSGEIDKQTTNKYSVITIKNYDIYQTNDTQNDTQNANKVTSNLSNERQTNGKQTTTNKQFKQNKQEEQYNNNPPISPQGESESAVRFIKPTAEMVQAYCDERNNGISGQEFIDHYESKGWKVGKTPMKDWKAAVRTWESKRKQNNTSGYTKRWNV